MYIIYIYIYLYIFVVSLRRFSLIVQATRSRTTTAQKQLSNTCPQGSNVTNRQCGFCMVTPVFDAGISKIPSTHGRN